MVRIMTITEFYRKINQLNNFVGYRGLDRNIKGSSNRPSQVAK